MKKISFFLITVITSASLFFVGCTKDSDLETPDSSILPDNFGVDIATALS